MHSMLIKTEKPILYNFIRWCYILFAVMIEEDESSWLKMPNWPAVLAGYRPLSTALYTQIEVLPCHQNFAHYFLYM